MVRGRMGNQSVGARPQSILCSFPGAHLPTGSGGWPLPLRGAVGDGVGSRGLGGALRAVLAGWPEHQAVFNLLPLHWDWGASKLYMLFKTRVSVSYSPYNKPY